MKIVMKSLAYIFIFSAFLLVGCSKNPITQRLADVESVMDLHPDSALSLLDSISQEDLKDNESNALYALLRSQALDKNYIDVTNDSLINIAVDFFSQKDLSVERMKAFYYLGCVQYNAKLYAQANVSFSLSEKDAVRLNDNFYLGLINRAKMNIYNATYNHNEELYHAKKSYEYFYKTQQSLYIAYAQYSNGIAKYNQRKFDEALSDFISLRKLAINLADKELEINTLYNIVSIYIEKRKIEEAISTLYYIRDSLNFELSAEQNYDMAYVYAIKGKVDSTLFYMNKGNFENNSIKCKYRKYQIARELKHYDEALKDFETISAMQDSIFREILEESVIAYERDYIREQSKFAQYKFEAQRKFSIIIFSAVICVLFLILVVILKQMKIRKIEISKYMDQVCELQDNITAHNKKISKMNELVTKLFNDKFNFIDNLSNTYYARHNTSSEQISIYKEVKKAIDQISANKYTRTELERIINECKDNLMEKMRTQLPHFREVDFQLLSYIIVGFSNRAMSVFLDIKIDNLYNRIYRLKERIAVSEAPDRDIFLREIT